MRSRLIYFLVNNNYQYLEAERLARELRGTGHLVALIVIPHTLTVKIDSELFEPVIPVATPARLPWPRAWFRYLRATKIMRTALTVTAEDTLLMFTEFELLNHLAAHVFKECGGRAYLIEDGGVGSYIPLSLRSPEPYNLKDLIRKVTIRAIPKLGQTQFTKFDGILFPMLGDRLLNGVLLYRPMLINRNIPVSVIARPLLQRLEICTGRVVFLNQPLYSEYIQNEIDYSRGLRKILNALCVGYSEVFFKFHPREPVEARIRITAEILRLFPKLYILDGNQPFEEMIADLRPEAVASYNSTPLLNLSGTGVQPLFVYHLLPELRKAPSFCAMHALLDAWGYKFATNWNELASGYHAGTNFDNDISAIPLVEALALSTQAVKSI
jgi:hypothetical protein